MSGTPGLLALEKIANGCRVATAKTKMIVSAASRMFSAISLGVFCRLAPSTRAIIRSMKLSPGFCVILTTMRSDSTVVPPVTAERSPPDSRMTGADSPVMADSSTEAMPSTTSPSPGMVWPASTTTKSPCCSCGAATSSSATGGAGRPAVEAARDHVGLGLAQRVGLRLAAALGDGFGEVGEDDCQPEPDHGQPAEPATDRGSPGRCDQTAPISTMNMTGLRHSVRGSSLRSASGHGLPAASSGSSRPPLTDAFVGLGAVCSVWGGIDRGGGHVSEFLQRGARAQARAGR